MIIKNLDNLKAGGIITILICTVAFWAGNISGTDYSAISDSNSTLMSQWISDINSNNKILSSVLAFVLIVFTGIGLFRFIQIRNISETRSYLPVFIAIIVAGGTFSSHFLNSYLIASVFLLFIIHLIVDMYRKTRVLAAVFIASLLSGLLFLFDYRFVYLIVVLWIGIGSLKMFSPREWIITIIGFATPLYFLYAYLIIGGDNTWQVLHNHIVDGITTIGNVNSLRIAANNYIYLAVVTILLLSASVHLILLNSARKVRAVKTAILLLIVILANVVAGVVYNDFMLLTTVNIIPVSLMISIYIVNIRVRNTAAILVYSIILLMLANIYFTEISNFILSLW
jgi:hypothetical protein